MSKNIVSILLRNIFHKKMLVVFCRLLGNLIQIKNEMNKMVKLASM